MDARLVSLALLIALVFDGLIDPIVGHISDRTNTRWGRRLPYLYVAPLFLGGVLDPAVVAGRAGELPGPAASRPSRSAPRWRSARCRRPRWWPRSPATTTSARGSPGCATCNAWGGGLLMLLLAYGVFLPNAMLAREGYQQYGIAGAILMVATVLISARGQHKWVAHRPNLGPAHRQGHRAAHSARFARA